MFQGEIEINNGIIVSLISGQNTLKIIIDGKNYNFGNSFASVGFTDSHLHLLYGGEFLSMPDLTKARSVSECIDILKRNPFYRGSWLFGRGWNQENWENSQFPTKNSLDQTFPNEPVCLIRQDGHCLWLNSKALEICNITKNTPDPKSGKILRDENGLPNGILIDDAIELVRPYLPKYSKEQYLQFLKASINYLAQFGITTVHDMDVDPDLLSIYQDYFSSSQNKINTKLFLSGNKFKSMQDEIEFITNKYLKIVGLKYYMDGAFGSYGALLFEPYSDNPSTNGLQLLDEGQLNLAFHIASKNDLGLAIHSIGDKATFLILYSYQKYISENKKKLKFIRIEHCQLVRKEDIPKFKSLDISASIQPIHFISDYEMALKRLGNRTSYAYPWNSFLVNQVKICSGSDFPIENPNPLLGIYSLVNREKIDRKKIFGNEEIPIDEAIRSYTIQPSLSINEDPVKLQVGQRADLAILNANPYQIEKEELEQINVLATICQGNIIYQR